MQTVGAVLVVALLITPGATAMLLTDRFGRALTIAVGVGAVGNFIGSYLSYFVDGAAGGVIVLTQVAIFGVVLIVAPKHGLLAMRRQRRLAIAAHLIGASS
jgi:manganese/iron transport system permease protein